MFATRDQLDQHVLDTAVYFTCVQFHGRAKYTREEFKQLPSAIDRAKNLPRALVYAVNHQNLDTLVGVTENGVFTPEKGLNMTKFFQDQTLVAEFKDKSTDSFDLNEMSMPSIVGLYNKYSGKEPIKKFADKETAIKRTAAVLAEAKPAKREPGSKGRKAKFTPEMTIKLLVDENPRRGGAAERFNLFVEGQTVAQFLAAGGKRSDVRRNVRKGFIAVA